MERCATKTWHFASGTSKQCGNDAMALFKPNAYQEWEPICRQHLDAVQQKGSKGP